MGVKTNLLHDFTTTANLGAVIIFAVINTLCRMNGLEYAAE